MRWRRLTRSFWWQVFFARKSLAGFFFWKNKNKEDYCLQKDPRTLCMLGILEQYLTLSVDRSLVFFGKKISCQTDRSQKKLWKSMEGWIFSLLFYPVVSVGEGKWNWSIIFASFSWKMFIIYVNSEYLIEYWFILC